MENTTNFTKHINDFFEQEIHEFINKSLIEQPTNPSIIIDIKTLIGLNTNEYLNIFLSHILFKQKLEIDQLNKIKNKLIESNIKVVLDIENTSINLSMNNSIFVYETDKTFIKLNERYKKVNRIIAKIDVTFDDDLFELFDKIDELISDKIMNNVNQITHEKIEKTYIKFLTNILIKHLK